MRASLFCLQVRQAGSSDEPYIAAIVSPYNKRLPGLQSSVTWFRVEGGGKQGANVLEQVRCLLGPSLERVELAFYAAVARHVVQIVSARLRLFAAPLLEDCLRMAA